MSTTSSTYVEASPLEPVRPRPIAAMTFPFLSLPAELRCRIYFYAFVPESVRFSLLDNGISMYSFSTSRELHPQSGSPWANQEGFSTVPVSLSNFVISRQLWSEISDLFYTNTVCTFGSVEMAGRCLLDMSHESRSKIQKIAFTVSYLKLGDFWIRPGKDLEKILKKLPGLRLLTIQVRLEAFHTSKSSWEAAVKKRPEGETDKVAANWVHQFVWQGLETRLPFQESALSQYFLDEMKRLCGPKNVRVEPAGFDRYAGNLVDVVIGSSAPATRPRMNPPRLASFESVNVRVAGQGLRRLLNSA
jgi:hypothetical protein